MGGITHWTVEIHGTDRCPVRQQKRGLKAPVSSMSGKYPHPYRFAARSSFCSALACAFSAGTRALAHLFESHRNERVLGHEPVDLGLRLGEVSLGLSRKPGLIAKREVLARRPLSFG
jgi:hypothetical protein